MLTQKLSLTRPCTECRFHHRLANLSGVQWRWCRQISLIPAWRWPESRACEVCLPWAFLSQRQRADFWPRRLPTEQRPGRRDRCIQCSSPDTAFHIHLTFRQSYLCHRYPGLVRLSVREGQSIHWKFCFFFDNRAPKLCNFEQT